MPTHPRHHVVREGEIAIYHTWSRCVQRAFLCGRDPLTGHDYSYRCEWIEKLLEYLAGVFAVDVGNYTILSNHQHAILRTRPDIVTRWSDEEVAWRWICAWPQWNGDRWVATPSDQRIRKLLADPERLARVRKNLASLSWFMARWKEPIAKMANAEMGRHGHFYEQRYGCRELLEQAAVLIGLIYLDLNQLRAGLADSLASANYSAIQRRITQWLRAEAVASVDEFLKKRSRRRPNWELEVAAVEDLLTGCFLAPIAPQGELLLVNDAGAEPIYLNTRDPEQDAPTPVGLGEPNEEPATVDTPAPEAVVAEDDGAADPYTVRQETASDCDSARQDEPAAPVDASSQAAPAGSVRRSSQQRPTYTIHNRWRQRARRRASDQPILFMCPERYLELATCAARQCLRAEADAISDLPDSLAAELTQRGIRPERWPAALEAFDRRFGHAVGSAAHLRAFLARVAQRWLHGIRACRDVFT